MRLAREALSEGAVLPIVMNAANEIAVEAFLAKRIGFLEIAGIVEDIMGKLNGESVPDLEAVVAADTKARRIAQETIRQRN